MSNSDIDKAFKEYWDHKGSGAAVAAVQGAFLHGWREGYETAIKMVEKLDKEIWGDE